jgi:hypothetical protein
MNLPTADQRDAVVIYDGIVRSMALIGLYPDSTLDLVRAMITTANFGSAAERAVALDFLAASRKLEEDT